MSMVRLPFGRLRLHLGKPGSVRVLPEPGSVLAQGAPIRGNSAALQLVETPEDLVSPRELRSGATAAGDRFGDLDLQPDERPTERLAEAVGAQ
jgi:hypothetical protein